MTFSAEARAVFDAFMTTKRGIEDEFAGERAAAKASVEAAPEAKRYVPDQNAALSALKSTGEKLQSEFSAARESFRASELRRSPPEEDRDPFAGPERVEDRRNLRNEPAGDRPDKIDPFAGPERPANAMTAFKAYDRDARSERGGGTDLRA